MRMLAGIRGHKYAIAVGVSAVLTVAIAATASTLTGFQIVGKTVPFAYPWRLTAPDSMGRLTAWLGYALHSVLAWWIIYRAQRQQPKYQDSLRWFNLSMMAVHGSFAVLHLLQTRLFYDGLAQDVPELTAQGSVALMLILILIMEAPRRGLIFGRKAQFMERFTRIVRKYHGYVFAWATIYTFWYHPTEGTWGHLLGFFYMFMLFAQSTFLFNRAHLNKWWTFSLEAFVLLHGVVVAVFQGNSLWPMFAFGFGAMIVLTQMYGLGLGRRARWFVAAGFGVLVLATYTAMGRLGAVSEVVRIPVLEYAVVGLLYGGYLAVEGGRRVLMRRTLGQAPTD
jgi:hypothetical protein